MMYVVSPQRMVDHLFCYFLEFPIVLYSATNHRVSYLNVWLLVRLFQNPQLRFAGYANARQSYWAYDVQHFNQGLGHNLGGLEDQAD